MQLGWVGSGVGSRQGQPKFSVGKFKSEIDWSQTHSTEILDSPSKWGILGSVLGTLFCVLLLEGKGSKKCIYFVYNIMHIV